MKRNITNNMGIFIAVCGLDGSGKTTLIKNLEMYFKSMEREVYCLNQPTDFYRKNFYIKKFQYKGICEISHESMALLAAYDRMVQYETDIAPKLKNNAIVIMHRYVYATYAIFHSRGVKLKWLKEINKYMPEPQLTVFLEINANSALKRIKTRGGNVRIEEKSFEILNENRKQYKKVLPKDTLILNAELSETELRNYVADEMKKRGYIQLVK